MPRKSSGIRRASRPGVPQAKQKWQGYVDDPATGKRMTKTFTLKGDAAAWVREVAASLERLPSEPQERPLSIVDFYREHHGSWAHRPRTAEEVAGFMRVYVEPRWGGTPVQEWNRHEFDAWVARLQGGNGGPVTGDRLPNPGTGRLTTIGPARSQTLVAHIKAIVNRALDMDLIAVNPIDRAKRPTVQKTFVEEILSEEDFLRVCGYLPDWCRDAVYGLPYTGLRLGELNALTNASAFTTPAGRFLSIASTVDEDSKCCFSWKPYTKSGQSRVIPYPDHVEQRWAIPSRQENGGPGLLLPVGTSPDSPPVALQSWFRSSTGVIPMCRHSLADAWKAALKKAKVDPKWSIRDLRHLCASLLLDDGLNIEEVGVHLGHAIGSSQTQVYLHMMEGYQEKARRSLDRPLRLIRHEEDGVA